MDWTMRVMGFVKVLTGQLPWWGITAATPSCFPSLYSNDSQVVDFQPPRNEDAVDIGTEGPRSNRFRGSREISRI
jgi:hypothetical protein